MTAGCDAAPVIWWGTAFKHLLENQVRVIAAFVGAFSVFIVHPRQHDHFARLNILYAKISRIPANPRTGIATNFVLNKDQSGAMKFSKDGP